MRMRIGVLALTILAFLSGLATDEAIAARRLGWPVCRSVCADFLELCYDVCETSFGGGLRRPCRQVCKRRALRACRANQGAFCGDYG